MNNIDFSVIIPQRNAIDTLPRLFASIPDMPGIEIIVVDNTPVPITKADVGIDREYTLLWSSPDRCAGGARNVGIENAHGKWLIFSDADDYFCDGAFNTFYEHIESKSDVIYFCAEGIFPDTGERSDQADLYTRLVKNYLSSPSSEYRLRMNFHVPWAKMVRKDFVDENNIRYDEVVANNDDYFALLAGYYAKHIEAIDKIVYSYAVTRGSIMRRRSYDVIKTRYEVILRCNKFKREHNLSEYQSSIMYFFSEVKNYGVKGILEFICLLFKYKQNPLIGMSNWYKTYLRRKAIDKKEKDYIIK